ncbi:ABC transporter permease [Metallumcola ferriviriculae]|uniref:ABC transporter permease n=1 Tax=Metallumcola ferriviriculae TaxID=3039180 RepID=A0AAU0URM3_9FIRM|nr:ABC transporter permease [Desulfitibacteraceae bacterium MK1]
MRRILAMLRKESLEIRRDPYSLGIAILLPLIMLLLFGYAINLDLKNVQLAVWDQDKSAESRQYISSFSNSGYFIIQDQAANYKDIYRLMDRGEVDAALVIPPQFSDRLLKGLPAEVQTMVDGSFPPTAKVAINYTKAINEARSAEVVNGMLQRKGLPQVEEAVTVDPRVWYNPSLDSKNFIIPGLFGVLLMAFPPLLSVLAVVREKERGSIQQVMISPIKPYEFILGKLLPYGVIAFIEVLVILVAAVFWFQIPVEGSLLLFLLLSVIYVMCTVAIGLLASTVTRSQVVAMLLAIVITVMPSMLFSGFVYPIFNMPKFFQYYTYLFPARFFIEISRGIFLKGNGLSYLWVDILWLLGYTGVIITLASMRFKKKVA